MLQFDGEDGFVPAGVFCNFVVGQGVGSDLIWRKVLNPDRWNRFHTDELSRCHATVTSHDHVLLINQNGIREAKRTNAVGNLSDLVLGVGAGVLGIRCEVPDGNINDEEVATFWGDISTPAPGWG
jgi:hypothetical protein